jgi:hypothetical protein
MPPKKVAAASAEEESATFESLPNNLLHRILLDSSDTVEQRRELMLVRIK